MAQFLVKLNSDTAKVPTKGSVNSAGFDLYASRPCNVPAHGQTLVHTDISVAPQLNNNQFYVYFRIAPRSGLAYKHLINVHAGVIDADYRGEVGIVLINHSEDVLIINQGDRIAQLVFAKVEQAQWESSDELSSTERGEGGYGSTGK